MAGVIYRYVPGGSLTPFFEQESDDDDFTGLNLPVPSADGTFYGSSTYGGTGYGSIYRLSSTGVATTLANFDGVNTGANPQGVLVLATDGNYYGVCQSGGPTGDGTVFKVSPSGVLSAVASFDGNTTGGSPAGPLVQAGDGNFYGVTGYGPSYGDGTIFRVTPAGVITTLATFDYDTQGGPSDNLTLGSDGLLYGATSTGGPKDGGTLFKATLDGQITVLVAFDPAANGVFGGKVLQTPDGSFYVPLGWYGPGGRGAIVRYRNSSPSPTPTPVPPATPKIKGKTKLTTDAPKITIRGTVGTAGAYVEYRLGNGKSARRQNCRANRTGKTVAGRLSDRHQCRTHYEWTATGNDGHQMRVERLRYRRPPNPLGNGMRIRFRDISGQRRAKLRLLDEGVKFASRFCREDIVSAFKQGKERTDLSAIRHMRPPDGSADPYTYRESDVCRPRQMPSRRSERV